jgi:23S rRNA pseudouridine1911/1915/1917 synthase
VSDLRTLPVPDGLDGMRVDAGLSKLLGLSRTAVAAIAESGDVVINGQPADKSDRLVAGAWLEITLPAPDRPVELIPIPVDGMRILFEDDDIVVVDKPVGVAAHPSPGWTGPTVIGGLAAAGVRVSTSGAAERQGVVHRLDVGTTGVMVVAKSEHAYTVLKRAFKEPSTRPTTPSSRATPTRARARSTPPSTATPSTTTSGPWSPRADPASPTTR